MYNCELFQKNKMIGIRCFQFLLLHISFLLIIHESTNAATGNWSSKVTGSNIVYTTTDATNPVKDYSGNYLTVVYLENLGFEKIGKNSNETDVSWLLSQGYRVIELNYDHNEKAVSPNINTDIVAINDAIAAGSFCGYSNCSKYRSYVLFEGYRIKRDVGYFLDDPTVYNRPSGNTVGDSLYMDFVFPANATVTIPVILSFSYSNSYYGDANKHQRLNLAYTLSGFNDSFLEGAPANGIAWAIADHPKYCSWGNGKPIDGPNDAYKSYEVNPDAAQKVKSAIRTLRVLGENLGLSDQIGIYGFSRGSDAGSMAIGDKRDSIIENAGLHIGVSDKVQAAALGSGVFDFTQIYNASDDGDGNLETRCPWVWGPLTENYNLWYSMGSAYLVETSATAPTLFFYNTDDAHYYQDQIAHFKAKLDTLNVPTLTVTNYGTGHAVPQTSESLLELYRFFEKYFTTSEDSTQSGIGSLQLGDQENLKSITLTLSPNPATNEMQINFNLVKAGKVQIVLCSVTGAVFYKTEKHYEHTGQQIDNIKLEPLALPQGIYYIKIASEGKSGTTRFIKRNR